MPFSWKSALRPRLILIGSLALLIGAAGWSAWSRWVAPTRIGLINFRDPQFAEMLEANDSRWVTLERVDLTKLADANLGKMDAVYLFGRGLNLDDPQREAIQRGVARGTRVFVFAATNPASDVTDLQGNDRDQVAAYFENGGRKNLASLFAYTRRNLDGKTAFTRPVASPLAIPADVLFRAGAEQFFGSVQDFQAAYQAAGSFKPGRPKIGLLTSIYGPRNPNLGSMDELIRRMEARNWNVYPIAGMARRLEFLREIEPDLVVYVPHGRLASGRTDEAIRYLDERGIPLLTPIAVSENYDSWLTSQRGMQGGMMNQNIVMPELDGGAEPYVISAQFPNARGLDVPRAIPERVETFVERVEKRLSLRSKPNAEKKLAVVYYKGPGQNAMAAAALEVAPSLLNFLKKLQAEGYQTGPLPATVEEFQARVQRQGPVLGAYAEGAFADYLKAGDPELIAATDYEGWAKQSIAPQAYAEVVKQYGPAPGRFLATERDGKPFLALPRVQFGNVVLLPQLLPAMGEETSKLVHGAKVAPPHPYLATYLWARHGFKADALLHFGTHGSLEFTPWKQNALSQLDWPDALIGDLPHFYLYIINNIGEAIIAKRRGCATLISHLTPPFDEAQLYGPLKQLQETIGSYQATTDPALRAELVATITRVARSEKLDRDLKFDPSTAMLDDTQIEALHDYLMTVGLEKITRGLYTLGVPYRADHVLETTRMMSVDTVARARANLDLARGQVTAKQVDDADIFQERYHKPALADLDQILAGKATPESFLDSADLKRLARWDGAHRSSTGTQLGPQGRGRLPRGGAGGAATPGRPEGAGGGHPGGRPPIDDEKESPDFAAVRGLRDALRVATVHRDALLVSTDRELTALAGALGGRYVAPSSGGDAITNPDAVPTGRNLISIDAEKTPSPEAWAVGKGLAEQTIAAKVKASGQFPKKVAMTFWAGDFINTQGVDIAIALHLLGVEPVRNARGEVHDVRLIPADDLKRPRIDVVVQTSGQLRDIAASRLDLIAKAVRIAAAANDPPGAAQNHVLAGTLAAESLLKARGMSPADAKTFAAARIFGGANGSYGTGIMGLVEAGDRWEKKAEIANQYLNNMGATYTEDHWGQFAPGVFEGALQNTDTLLHSRSSHVNGPLSLDHVYEFMGGLNATITQVTGREPDAFFADLRNKQKPVMQPAEEAIWVEARATLLNPKYIRDLQAGGASSAAVFAESFRNTYAWNSLKPAAVDDALWDELYDVYINDRDHLGLRESFEKKNPFALQEMTAVMLETARKGLWEASPDQVRNLAVLHSELIRDHRPGCSGFVCDNAKLRQSIADTLGSETGREYLAAIETIRSLPAENSDAASRSVKGLALEKISNEPKAAPASGADPSAAASSNPSRPDQVPHVLFLVAGCFVVLLAALGSSGYWSRRS